MPDKASTPPTIRSPRRTALALLAALLLALVGLGAALAWAVASPTGTRTLLSWVPGLRIAGESGALLGNFAAEQAELALPRGGSLVLSRLRWQGLRLEHDDARAAAWALRLSIASLTAERAELHWVGDPKPNPPPESLKLPLAVDIARLRVGEFRFDPALAPLRELSLGLHLAGNAAGGAAGKESHRIENLSLYWERLQASGELSLGADAPLPLNARFAVKGEADAQADLPAFDAALSVQGPLQHFKLEARLRAEQQALDAQAQVQPFAAWPLAEVNASTRELDLAALWSAAPHTALSGQVVGHASSPSGKTQPLSLRAELQNGAAGRWDERRLPVRGLSLAIAGDIGSLQQRGELHLELGSARQAGGSLSATGRWNGPTWQLDAQLRDLTPTALDQRAPAIVLSGPLALNGRGGLPPFGTGSSAGPGEVGLNGRLQGRLLGAPGQGPAGPLALLLDASLSPQRISVRQLEAKAAGASAKLKGEAERVGASAAQPGTWQLRGTLALSDFDPRPWWAAARPQAGDAKPGAAKADARAIAPPPSPPRINADAQFDLRIPEEKAAGRKPRSLLQQLAAWRGQAKAQLRNSQFGGVPLAGELALESHAARQRLLGHARLEAGGNQLTLDGEIDATATASDRWKLQLQAPKLDSLAPLLRLLRPASPPQTSAGSLSAQAEAEGRWP
ncbi:MAG TPA: hypothetical protein VFV25_06090, partial [Methylibium sp.]